MPDQYHFKDSHLAMKAGGRGKIRNFPTGYSGQISELAAKCVFEKRDQFDLLAITGDIATVGTVGCLTVARDYTHSLPFAKWLNTCQKPTLQAALQAAKETKKKMILMPGNHDRYADKDGTPGGDEFNNSYSDEWPTPREFVHHCVVDDGPDALVCIAVDFCLRNREDAGRKRWDHWGQGIVHDDARKHLVLRTKEMREKYKGAVVIWLIHFPPVIGVENRYQLNESEKVVDEAAKNGIPLILSGHLHENRIDKTSNGIPVLCAGSMTGLGNDYWMHFINLTVDNGTLTQCSKTDYQYDKRRQNFVKGKTHEIIK